MFRQRLFPVVMRCSLRTLSQQHSPSSSYKAVIFDMYGVLLPSPVIVATEFERQHGLPIGTVGGVIRDGGRGSVWQRFMRGEVDVEEFTRAFGELCSKRAGCRVPIGELYLALIGESMRQPIQTMLDALQCVRQRGLKTALLSNNFIQPDGQPFMPLDPALFDVVVQSVKEGISKPDPRIFEACLGRLGMASKHVVFLDDIMFNVRAACDLGITAIQVKEPTEAVLQLEELLGFSLRPSTLKKQQRSQRSQSASQPITAPSKRLTTGGKGEQTNFQPIRNKLKNSQSITSQDSDLQQTAEKLAKYLQTHLSLSVSGPVIMHPFQPLLDLLTIGGQQLFLVRVIDRGVIATINLETEIRLLKFLLRAGIPVPQVIHHCQDRGVIGDPFILLEVCGDGRSLSDPSLLSHTPTESRAMREALIQMLCQIHKLSEHTDELQLPVRTANQQVGPWISVYQALQRSSQPITASQTSKRPMTAMERLCTWLPLHLPSKPTRSLLHGNYRCVNTLFGEDCSDIVCVLDWSLAALGDPLSDLSTCWSSLPEAEQRGPDIPTPEHIIGQYCEWMGQEMRADWRFYVSLELFIKAVKEQIEVAAEFQALQGTKKAELSADRRVERYDWLWERLGRVERRAELAWDFAVQEGFRQLNP